MPRRKIPNLRLRWGFRVPVLKTRGKDLMQESWVVSSSFCLGETNKILPNISSAFNFLLFSSAIFLAFKILLLAAISVILWVFLWWHVIFETWTSYLMTITSIFAEEPFRSFEIFFIYFISFFFWVFKVWFQGLWEGLEMLKWWNMHWALSSDGNAA